MLLVFLYDIPTQGSLCYSYTLEIPQILSDGEDPMGAKKTLGLLTKPKKISELKIKLTKIPCQIS